MKKVEFKRELKKAMETLFGKDKVKVVKTPQVYFCLWIKDKFGVATDYRDFEDRVWAFRYVDSPRESIFDVLGDYKTCLETLILQAEYIYNNSDGLRDTSLLAGIYSSYGSFYERNPVLYPSDTKVGEFMGFLHRLNTYNGDYNLKKVDCTVNFSHKSDTGTIGCTWVFEIDNPENIWITRAKELCQGVIVEDNRLMFEFSSDNLPIGEYIETLRAQVEKCRGRIVMSYWENDKLDVDDGLLWVRNVIMKD